MHAWAHSPAPGLGDDQAHELRTHLESVAALAEAKGGSSGVGDIARLAGLWHDIGKYRPAFQAYIRGAGPQASHKLAGASHAITALDPALGTLVALSIAGHHGGIPVHRGGTRALIDALPEAATHLAEALSAGAPLDILGAQLPPSSAAALHARLRGQPSTDQLVAAELLARAVFSSLVDADYQDTAAFYDPIAEARRHQAVAAQASLADLATRLDARLDRLMLSAHDAPVQAWRKQVLAACRAAADQPPGVFELTVPTGGGKTLAAMSFALRHAARHGLQRVIVAIPFTSIVEQNAAVYAEALGPENVLEHHSAWDPVLSLRDLAPSLRGTARHRQKLLSENWDAPVVVTTNVQLLESLHANRPAACRKVHNIASSVLIFDEAQTLPAHLLAPTLDTLRVLSRLMAVTIVVCTATQPALARRSTATGMVVEGLGSPVPIVAEPSGLFSAMSRVKVRWPTSLTEAVTWEELAAEVRQEARALVIVHRRADARLLAELVGPSALHLSATMLPSHRSATLQAVRERLKQAHAERCLLVATQVVEAGVDIDFPVVYRAFAGLDSLAQAAGRCNREGLLAGRGEFRIFVAPTPPPHGILERAQVISRGMVAEGGGVLDLDDPDLYRRFYARLYDTSDTDAPGLKGLRQGLGADFPEIARRYELIDSRDQIPVVVPWSGLDQRSLSAIQRLRAGFADQESFRRIHRASVSVHRRVVLEWLRRGVVAVAPAHSIAILDLATWPGLYSERFGLDIRADPEIEVEDLVL